MYNLSSSDVSSSGIIYFASCFLKGGSVGGEYWKKNMYRTYFWHFLGDT
jgi:hypothetical protein